MSNIHIEYTSRIFHKNMKNIYMHYGRVMRGVVNIVYFFLHHTSFLYFVLYISAELCTHKGILVKDE